MITTNLHPEVIKFFKSNGILLDDGHHKYVYYPFWLKILGDGLVEVVQWDNVPDDLKELIIEKRNGHVSFINAKFTTSNPELIEGLKNHPLNKANKPK